MGSSNSSTDQKEQKTTTADDLQAQKDQQMALRIGLIQKSIQHDKSIPNVLIQFSKVLELEGSNMSHMEAIIQNMKCEWKFISDHLDDLLDTIGAQEVNGIKKIRFDYFSLLLKTKNVISGLCESSIIQQENIECLLDFVNTAKVKGTAQLTQTDKHIYDASLKTLGKWIDQKELEELLLAWKAICDALEAKTTMLGKVFTEYKRLKWFYRTLIVFGTIVVLGSVIALILLTAGAAAAIAAPVAKTITVFGIKMLTPHVIGCGAYGLALSTVSVVGGLSGVYYIRPAEKQEKINKIISVLTQLIQKGLIIKTEISNLKDKTKPIDKRLAHLDNLIYVTQIERSLKAINKYLKDYVDKGQKVISVVESECKQIINLYQ